MIPCGLTDADPNPQTLNPDPTCPHLFQADILALVSYLDVCSVNGGSVRGGRTGFDNNAGNVVQCPDPNPPPGFGCSIAARTTNGNSHDNSNNARSPPPPPPPPPPPGANPVLRMGPGQQAPRDYREISCQEVPQYQVRALHAGGGERKKERKNLKRET